MSDKLAGFLSCASMTVSSLLVIGLLLWLIVSCAR